AGATILSSEVAGEKVKPVQGADGSRVPLLRQGFRPTDSYQISFVFLHAGTPFAKKGGTELALPKMDVPIGRMEWEVFLPERYRVTNFGGDALAAALFSTYSPDAAEELRGQFNRLQQFSTLTLEPGQLGGVVVDPTGAAVAGVNIEIKHVA